MGYQVYRYHEAKAPAGAIFDSEHLPSEKDGWFDSPKKFKGYQKPAEPAPDPGAPSGEFPDPVPFADVHAYKAAVTVPDVPSLADAPALGLTPERVEEMAEAAKSVMRRSLLHYAKRKHGRDLARNLGPGQLLTQCEALDKAAG